MANTIKLKRGTGSDPSASDLVLGEIAIRTDTGKLFTKKDNGTVAEISGSGGGGSDIFINTLSSSSGSGGGSASFNGSATRFTLSNPPDVSAQQLLVSINGVIQKPNSGTSPSEGFALDGTDIIFAAAPATGADFFIITYGSIGVSVPADNSVTSAKIVDGTIVGTDLATNVDLVDDQKIRFGTGNDLQIYHDPSSGSGLNLIKAVSGYMMIQQQGNGSSITLAATNVHLKNHNNNETFLHGVNNGAVKLYYDNSTKLETTSTGVNVSGSATIGNDLTINSGNQEQILRDWSSTTDSDISGLLSGSTFGTVHESAHNGHHVIALRGNDTNDSFAIISGGSNYQTDSTYDKLIARFHANGVLYMPDNNRIKLGTGSDLQIYHDGSNSFVNNSTGYLLVRSSNGSTYYDANNHFLRNAGGSENMAKFLQDGACELYFDNSKKFETISSGVQVTGELYADGVRVGDDEQIRFGDGEDLRLYHSGSHGILNNITGSFQVQDAGTEKFRVSGTGTFFKDDIHLSNDNDKLNIGAGNDLQIYHNGTNNYLDSANGHIYLRLNVSASSQENAIKCTQNGNVEISYDASKKFETTSSGISVTGNGVFTGNVAVNDNSHLYAGNSGDIDIFHDGTNGIIANNSGVFYLKTINGEFTLVGRPNAQTELYYDHSKKFETISSGIKILGDSSTGSIIQGDLRLKAADSGTTLVHWNPENNEIRWDDDYKAAFGDSGDLTISHSSTYNNSLIYNGTNDLYFRSGTAFYFQNKAGSENQATFVENGRVDLYYDNSRKLQTTSGGVDITGTMMADGIQIQDSHKINLGNSQDLQIYHNGTSSFIDNHNSGHIYIRNNDGSDFGGNIYIQAKSGENSISIIHDGSVQLFYDNDRVFYTETRGVRLADNTKIYENSSHNTAVIQHADIHHAIILRGATNNNGSTITNENTTTFREYGQMQFRTGGNGNMPVRLTIASNGVVSGNLNDTSDEKFKENIVSIADGAISKIKQLRPVNFDWKKEMQVEDAKGESGFIAQEVLTVIPDLVKGIEYKEDEKSSGYSVNTTGLVAYLTKALQEVIARLETLEGG